MHAPRHARPSRLPARLAAGTALGGLLLPALPGTAAAQERSSTTTRVSAPAGTVRPGAAAPVSVRLLSGRAYVRDAVVDVQVAEGSGWRTVARTATDSSGLGRTTLHVSRDMRVRAHYRGSASRAAATSAADVIDVASAPARGVLAEAARLRGRPYRYGAAGPDAFDCSGFTRYVYARATGRTLPHSSHAQEDVARRVSKAQARPGDLVFIQGSGGHVGIYAGNGQMWDAPGSGRSVTRRAIWTSHYTVGRV